eukprot:jgi/Astpho2/6084/Aster-04031
MLFYQDYASTGGYLPAAWTPWQQPAELGGAPALTQGFEQVPKPAVSRQDKRGQPPMPSLLMQRPDPLRIAQHAPQGNYRAGSHYGRIGGSVTHGHGHGQALQEGGPHAHSMPQPIRWQNRQLNQIPRFHPRNQVQQAAMHHYNGHQYSGPGRGHPQGPGQDWPKMGHNKNMVVGSAPELSSHNSNGSQNSTATNCSTHSDNAPVSMATPHPQPQQMVPIDDILWRIKRLPPHDQIDQVAAECMPQLHSRGLAALMKELGKSGLSHRAFQLFDWLIALPEGHMCQGICDVYVYTAMISNCVAQQDMQRALSLSEQMRSKSLERNVHTYSALMNVCIKSGQLQQGRQQCSPAAPMADAAAGLTGVCCKGEHPAAALTDFHSLRTAPFYVHANCLRPDRQGDASLCCCGPHVSCCTLPDSHCLPGAPALSVSGRAGAGQAAKIPGPRLLQALEVYGEMQQEGCMPNIVTYNTLIDVYGKLGQWQEALGVLETLRMEGIQPVTRTCNTLMIACNTSGQWQEALRVYEDMLAAGHVPNTTTYNALITAHSKAGSFNKVLEAFQQMVQQGERSRELMYMHFTRQGGCAALLCTTLERPAAHVRPDLPQGCQRSVITYSSLISACEKAGEWRLALQLLEEMRREGCNPNVISYNSLITACAQGAQWERAAELFQQMQQQHCMPDVVTYTALIGAYEKGHQWRQALQVFESSSRTRCTPDAILYTTMINTLWETGLMWAQQHAASLFKQAHSEGLLRRCVLQTLEGLELTLHSACTGVALLTLHTWLEDLREQVANEGPVSLPSSISIAVGRTKRSENGTHTVKEAVMAVLQSCHAPFREHSDGSTYVGRLQAHGPDLATWLGSSALESSPLQNLVVPEGRSTSGVLDAFRAVHFFEQGHRPNMQAMPAAYLQQRRSLVHTAVQMADTLELPEEISYDAVLLMDCLLSHPGAVTDIMLLPTTCVACLLIIMQQTCSMEQMPSKQHLEHVPGLQIDSLVDVQAKVLSVLHHDTAAISAVRCLKLFLERLGCAFGEGDEAEHQQEAVAQTLAIMARTLQDNASLNFRPSIIAAAVLYCARRGQGQTPFWPVALVALTGYSATQSAELVAAITTVQRLKLFELDSNSLS